MLATEFDSCSCGSEVTGVSNRGVARAGPPAAWRYSPYAHQHSAALKQHQCCCCATHLSHMLPAGQQQPQQEQQHRMPRAAIASLRHQPLGFLAKLALQLSERSIDHTLDALRRVTDASMAATEPNTPAAAAIAQMQEQCSSRKCCNLLVHPTPKVQQSQRLYTAHQHVAPQRSIKTVLWHSRGC